MARPVSTSIGAVLGVLCDHFPVAFDLGLELRSDFLLAPFECGSEPIGSPRGRYSVTFFQVAILFLVFDIEAAFMFPWALLYRDNPALGWPGLGLFGFVEMLVFVAILVVALTYVWRKKAIGWE